MAYQKQTVVPGDVITSSWGNHIQTQYDEAVDYVDEQLANIPPPPVTSVNGKTGDVQLTASDVGAPTAQQHDQLEQKVDAHQADDTIHKTSDVIRTETGTKLKVEVVSSSGSESPEQGRIIFDMS